jgi:hypothetical protein
LASRLNFASVSDRAIGRSRFGANPSPALIDDPVTGLMLTTLRVIHAGLAAIDHKVATTAAAPNAAHRHQAASGARPAMQS